MATMASTPLDWKGIEAIVFRAVGDRPPLRESLFPAEVLRLTEGYRQTLSAPLVTESELLPS